MLSVSDASGSAGLARRETTEDEALAADRDDGQTRICDPDVGERSHGCDLDVSTVPDTSVHDPTSIVGASVIGQ